MTYVLCTTAEELAAAMGLDVDQEDR